MKFTIPTLDMLDALKAVHGAIGRAIAVPILSNILIDAAAGTLTLTATDLDVSVRISTDANVTKAGSTTLPARHLIQIVNSLTSETLEFDCKKDQATLTSGPSHFKLKGLSSDEYPPVSEIADGINYQVPANILKESLHQTSFAVSKDETRYALNGALFVAKSDRLTIVATDGRRLSVMANKMDWNADQESSLIIPTKAINEIKKALSSEAAKNNESVVTMTFSGLRSVSFQIGGIFILSKTIDANYPSWEKVIPGDPAVTVTLDRQSLLRTVHRVALLSSAKSHNITLSFTDGQLEVFARSPDVGEAKETLPIQYSGDLIEISFNPDFLQAPLKHLTDDEIHLDLVTNSDPAVIRTETEGLKHIVMPTLVTS